MKSLLHRVCIKITGFKPARYFEWQALIKAEAKRVNPWLLALQISKGALGLGKVDRMRWRARLRYGCGRCPIYDKARHACRDTQNMGLGCGCWMPGKALVKNRACWIRQIGDTTYGFD